MDKLLNNDWQEKFMMVFLFQRDYSRNMVQTNQKKAKKNNGGQ